MNPSQYLVHVKSMPTQSVLQPAEAVALAERFVLPTLQKLEELEQGGEIVAGGPHLGGMSFSFVVEANSPQQVETLVTTLPIWTRAETTITPLARFSDRLTVARERVAQVKAQAAQAEAAGASAARTKGKAP